jgi:amidase
MITSGSRDRAEQNPPGDEINFVSAVEIARMIRERKVSSLEAVRACYRRIDEVNPRLNAVIQFCRDRALKEAGEADALLARGESKGPLHGVPMTIKDSIDTEGVISTGGTLGRANFMPEKDAAVVERLRRAGAILLGKTNTPEFTLGGIPGLGTTGNIVYGMTRNPYDVRRTTQGSSGGAGAIVAAGGAYFDIGSDFGGSIRNPAHANGIAGIKPTTGRVPRTGHIVDYGGVFDAYQQLGPLARRVEDLTLILPLISGPDFVDAAIVPMPWAPPEQVDLKKLRIAFYTDQGEQAVKSTPETEDTVKRCAQYFAELGCPVEEARPPRLTEASEITSKLGGGDGGAWIKRLSERHGTKTPGPGRRFDQPQIPTPQYTELMEQLDAWRSEMLRWVQKYELILCPETWRPAGVINEGESPTPRRGGNFAAAYNHTGWPAGVVRAGTSPEGLPIGIHAIAQPWREDVVLAALRHVEQKSGGWVRPPM